MPWLWHFFPYRFCSYWRSNFIPFEHTFDFDDETVFFSTKYRIVVTSQVIRSGGQSYIAVLNEMCSRNLAFSNPSIAADGTGLKLKPIKALL